MCERLATVPHRDDTAAHGFAPVLMTLNTLSCRRAVPVTCVPLAASCQTTARGCAWLYVSCIFMFDMCVYTCVVDKL